MENLYPKVLLLIIIILINAHFGYALTGQQVSNNCHCDLTTSYCDFGCCCDTDCSTAISQECYLSRSSIFCLNSSYYYKIDSTLKPSPTNSGCYYYNSTTAIQEQVVISSRQIGSIAYQNVNSVPLANGFVTMNKGYTIGDKITISGNTDLIFVDSTGTCSTSTTRVSSPLYFRMNTDISCSISSNSVNIFTNLLGKSVISHKLTQQAVTIPQPDNSSYNEILVIFFVARYGSSKTQYIQDIKTVAKSNGIPNVQTLRVRFVDPLVDLQQQQSQPSFFPQIPKDIFYPIYQFAYSY